MTLLERDTQLEALDNWLREAAGGQGRLVLIGGEAGVGKSVLVDEFCQAVAAAGRGRVLRGACDALSTPRPLGPLQDIAVQTGGVLDQLLIEDAPRAQLFRAVLAELNRGLTPTVAVFEDAHWADEATLDLLRFLGRRLETARTLLIATYRDDELGAMHPLRLVLGDLATTRAVRRLHLAPLSADGVRTLAEGSGVDPLSLYRLSCGNPFFATEVLAAEDGAPGGIPPTVRDAVLARASRLTSEGRAALEAAAVIGSPVDEDLLTEVIWPGSAMLDECLSSGMLVALAGRAYAFRHELARVAILETIVPRRRRELHRRVLLALQTVPTAEQDLARLAHHAEGADDPDAVLRFAPVAARRAALVHAHREAAAQFARALRFARSRPPQSRADLLEAAAYECYLTGQSTEAVVLQHEALQIWREIGDRFREGDALRKLSRFSWFASDSADAVAAADEAVAVLELLPPGQELAMALSNRAQLYMLAEETASAVTWGERAIALAQDLSETEILVHALTNVGTARLMAGDERGRDELERSLALARQSGHEEHVARALTNLSGNAVLARDLTHAEAYLADGVTFATDHDLEAWRLYMLGCRGLLRLLQGEWTAAANDADAVLTASHAAEVTRVMALVTRGLVLARRGEPGVAAALDEALALAERTGELQRLGQVRVARAEAAWLTGADELAAAEAREVLDLALRRGSPWAIREVLLWCHRADSGVTIDGAPVPTSLPTPYRRALTGDWAGAAAAWEELGCPYDAALALLDGDEPAVRRALASFEQLGARPAATRAVQRLRALGARAIPRGPIARTRTNPAGLTARELEIVPLIAAGLRNAEIADRLYLSPKTVGHHIGHILAKLGVQSRADVATAARQLGLSLTDEKVGVANAQK